MSTFKQNLFTSVTKKNKYKNILNFKIPYPKNKFVIYTRGRTGSTVLSELINCHPDVFCDVEIFNFLYSNTKVKLPHLYINSCSKRALIYGKSVYGFKVKISQLKFEHKYPDYGRILSRLNDEGWKFIHLNRENFLRHKLSNLVLSQTNVFHLQNGDSKNDFRINVDCQALLEGIKYGEEVERLEEEDLRNIPHLKLNYEKNIRDNSALQETADKVFTYLNLKSQPVKTGYKKIVPENLEEIVTNYKELYQFFKDTKYQHYLND